MGSIEDAGRALHGAYRVLVLTGAGISTASGIPDFRGPEGVWTKDPAAEMLSTFEVWASDASVRRRAWQSRVARRHEVHTPNAGHRALVELGSAGRVELLVTQNIDGLHQDAGSEPALVVEIHGTSRDYVCLACADRGPIGVVLDRVASGDDDPRCERQLSVSSPAMCGGLLKSATISFGQSLVAADLERSERAARNCDAVLAVGSTLSVWPAASLVPLASSRGATIVIVNGGETAMDELADVRVGGAIEEVLPIVITAAVAPA